MIGSRRGSFKIAFAAIGAFFTCCSCAIFPSGKSFKGFTAITFSFRVAGKIRVPTIDDPLTYYVYDVGITASQSANPPITLAPIPTLDPADPNFRMAGSPTHFVEFNSPNPTSTYPYALYRFATAKEVPPKYDLNNPINLGVWAPSQRGPIARFTTPNESDPSTLSFTVYTSQLADSDDDAQKLKSLFVNFLTMTKLSSSPSHRVIDAIGPSASISTLSNFIQIDLTSDRVYTNSAAFEPTGDTYGGSEPDVDIVDYTITITHP